ncbi:DUF4303 domain-containing protein [Dactylosporangium aurantiacum]|nr:DUF4303 domain-containing protein [Dactylosporangium aurantiacum]MDG6109866.1 DUF4303 domain-containing protein [Dactylosporangium aurantiacum]
MPEQPYRRWAQALTAFACRAGTRQWHDAFRRYLAALVTVCRQARRQPRDAGVVDRSFVVVVLDDEHREDLLRRVLPEREVHRLFPEFDRRRAELARYYVSRLGLFEGPVDSEETARALLTLGRAAAAELVPLPHRADGAWTTWLELAGGGHHTAWMNLVVAFAGPVIALLGVWLGTRMSNRAQLQAWEQERQRQAADTRRVAFARHLTAIRAYIAYVTAHPQDVAVLRNADGTPSRPAFNERGEALREALETTYIELQLVAAHQESVNQAHAVSRAARRIAVAAADRDAELRAKLLVFWELERRLVNELRLELGQDLQLAPAYDPDAVLP